MKKARFVDVCVAFLVAILIGASMAWADGDKKADDAGRKTDAAAAEKNDAKKDDAKKDDAKADSDKTEKKDTDAKKADDKKDDKTSDAADKKTDDKKADDKKADDKKADDKKTDKSDKAADSSSDSAKKDKSDDAKDGKKSDKKDGVTADRDKSDSSADGKSSDKSKKSDDKKSDSNSKNDKSSGKDGDASKKTSEGGKSGASGEKLSGSASTKSAGTVTDISPIKTSGSASGKDKKGLDAKAAESASTASSSIEKLSDKSDKAKLMSPENKDNVLVWLYKSMGTRYVVIFLIVTFNGIALVVMIILGLRQRYLCPPGLAEGFEVLLDAKEYQKAYLLARRSKSYLGKILAAGMANLNDSYQTALEAMQDVGEVENLRMEQRNSHIALIGQIGPMLGLLATVDGIVSAFTVIAGKNVTPKPAELAASIGIALVNTIVGLWLAIPSIIFYHIIRNRLARMVLEVGVISARLMRRFANAPPIHVDANVPDGDDESLEPEAVAEAEGEAKVEALPAAGAANVVKAGEIKKAVAIKDDAKHGKG